MLQRFRYAWKAGKMITILSYSTFSLLSCVSLRWQSMKRTRTYKKVLSKIPAKRIAIDSHLVLYIGKDTCQSCLWLTVTPNQLLYSYSLRMACNHRLIEDAIPRTRNRREKQQQQKKKTCAPQSYWLSAPSEIGQHLARILPQNNDQPRPHCWAALWLYGLCIEPSVLWALVLVWLGASEKMGEKRWNGRKARKHTKRPHCPFCQQHRGAGGAE